MPIAPGCETTFSNELVIVMSLLYVKNSRSHVLLFGSGHTLEIIESGLDYRKRHSLGACPVRIEELNGDMSAQGQGDVIATEIATGVTVRGVREVIDIGIPVYLQPRNRR